jgi:phage replication-related protein YjqB (UPF0714/DUF867 family)
MKKYFLHLVKTLARAHYNAGVAAVNSEVAGLAPDAIATSTSMYAIKT